MQIAKVNSFSFIGCHDGDDKGEGPSSLVWKCQSKHTLVEVLLP